MKAVFEKIFSNKKAIIPYFASIIAIEIAIVVLSLLNRPYWIVFANALTIISIVLATFLTYWFKKNKATRFLITALFFVQTMFFIAYAIMPYPKTPIGNYASFVLFIFYAAIFFASCFAAVILHMNYNKQNNARSLFALQILYCLQLVITIALAVFSIIGFVKHGWTPMLMIDLLFLVSYGLTTIMNLTIEQQILPAFDKAKKSKK